MNIDLKVTILGSGFIGTAFIKQFLNFGFKPENIVITRRTWDNLVKIKEKFNVTITKNNKEAVKNADIIILCVRPQEMSEICQEISDSIQQNQIVISVAVGLELDFYEKYFPKNPVARIMPNPFLEQGVGCMFYSKNKIVNQEHDKEITELFKPMSDFFLEIEDRDMHVFTTIGSSSSALYYYIFNTLLEKALDESHADRLDARKAILISAVASAKGCIDSEKTLQQHIQEACTPGGMTYEGIKYLDKKSVSNEIKKSIQKIIDRSEEINKDLNKKV